jgi:hypothetical protein
VEQVNHEIALEVSTIDLAMTVPPHAVSVTVDLPAGEARIDWRRDYTVEVCEEFGWDGSSERCRDEARSETGTRRATFDPLDRDRFCGPDADQAIAVFHEHIAYADVTRPLGSSQAPSCANGLVYAAPILGAPCYDVVRRREDEPNIVTTICPTGSLALKFAITTVTEDRWWPQETVDGLLALHRAGCTPAYDAIAGGRLGGGRCIDVGGGEICPSDAIYALIDPPPFDRAEAQVDRLATRVRADTAACTPFVPVAESCAPLEADPSCAFRDTRPVAGPGVTDVLLHEDIYDCETARTVRSAAATGALSCPPAVRGIGEDLVTPVYETNTSFHEVAGRMAALQFTSMDTACGDPDDSSVDPLDCTVFEGERRTCKVAAFGIVDCCDSPGGVSLTQYLQLAFAIGEIDSAIGEIDSAIGNLDPTVPLVGAWEKVAGPFDAAYDIVTTNFASGVNSITGIEVFNASDVAQQGLIATVKQGLMTQTAEWTASIFGDAAANTLFTAASDSAVPAFTNGVMHGSGVALSPTVALVASALSYVMLAYTIYQVATLIATIVWSCSEADLETAVKRDLKACRYNGTYCSDRVFGLCLERRRSYCCFASPLSRIMQEQIRIQNGAGWGSARNPNCAGLSIAALQSVDFGALDLSEWVDLLIDSGAMPEAGDMDLEALTGAGNPLAGALPAGLTRLNAADRSVSRALNVDNEAVRLEAQRQILGELGE